MKRKFNIGAIQNKRPNLFDPNIIDERKYLLFPNDNAVTSSLMSNILYEPYLYQFIKENDINVEGTTIVDVGGNNGQIAVEFAHLVGDTGKVVSFEPQRIIFQQLCANVFVNGLDNVWAFNIALGEGEGVVNMEKPDYFSQGPVNFGNVHIGLGTNLEPVIIKPLDSFGIKGVSIIKIDVQGFEKKVLLGAKETIQKNRPIIYIEIESDQLELYGETEQSVFEILSEMGYSYRRFNDGLPYQTTSGLCLDFVAIPNEIFGDREWKTIFH